VVVPVPELLKDIISQVPTIEAFASVNSSLLEQQVNINVTANKRILNFLIGSIFLGKVQI
jgi:copper chaperone CopZ